MNTPQVFLGIDQASLSRSPLHLAIGMFDGVHLGHQAVIESAVHSAVRTGGQSGVLTFWPHPSALVQPERRTRLMMAPETKHKVLSTLGVNFIIEQPFGTDFAKIAAEDFLPHLKKALPSLAGVYVGDNWRFGTGRRGDSALLLATAAPLGVSVFSAPRVQFNGVPISSTLIREHLRAGRIEQVNALLGYSYFAEGESIPGRRLGRTLGFPTLNLPWEPELTPAYGVYAVRVAPSDRSVWYPGIANYGLRPTVDENNNPLLEVHLLVDCPFACGDAMVVEWLKFLRPERRFTGLEELKAQIQNDCLAARAEFSLPQVG